MATPRDSADITKLATGEHNGQELDPSPALGARGGIKIGSELSAWPPPAGVGPDASSGELLKLS